MALESDDQAILHILSLGEELSRLQIMPSLQVDCLISKSAMHYAVHGSLLRWHIPSICFCVTSFRVYSPFRRIQSVLHTILSISSHEPDHWRPTINANVHRRVVPGTQTRQGKGRRGGSDTVTGSARVYRIVPSSVTTRKKSFIILL